MPIIPGFVIVHVVPAKSSGDTLPLRTFVMSSSYACPEVGEVERVGVACTFGTRSECVPSRRFTSTASPRFTCW